MDDISIVYEWAKTYEFDEVDLYYCTLLALKILDKKCKMNNDDFRLFMSVYDGIADKRPSKFTKKVHKIIELARTKDPIVPKEEYKEAICKLREAMMTNMKKEEMKAFKQKVWGILPC